MTCKNNYINTKGKRRWWTTCPLFFHLMTETTPLNNPPTSSSLSCYLTRPPKTRPGGLSSTVHSQCKQPSFLQQVPEGNHFIIINCVKPISTMKCNSLTPSFTTLTFFQGNITSFTILPITSKPYTFGWDDGNCENPQLQNFKPRYCTLSCPR